ncbi:hypothetical protein D5018_17315 [Parashewanella curva]|uniref:Uncharacterized protein n=1 Tax=Parashewanella curva TaxID=2338552 RepID=A0A3L8PVI2_9GAMM|nr:hypothetical protein [Parashewanella curva]RLV58438.1 hypothetical protein D5018_17315 [Parashewanella curva]
MITRPTGLPSCHTDNSIKSSISNHLIGNLWLHGSVGYAVAGPMLGCACAVLSPIGTIIEEYLMGDTSDNENYTYQGIRVMLNPSRWVVKGHELGGSKARD